MTCLTRLTATAGKGLYRHDAEGSDDMPVLILQ